MKFYATVIAFDHYIEELVVLDVLGNSLTCFASVCPYPITLGNSYPVELYVQTFDELKFEQVDRAIPDSIVRNDGFHYTITGKLHAGEFVSNGVAFRDDDDFSDIRYLQGETLKVIVDRLDVLFCD